MIITLKNTTSAEVASRIVELRDERGSAALSRVLTLLICVPDLIDVDNAIEVSDAVSREHPCRVIVIVEPESTEGTARLNAQIRVAGNATHPSPFLVAAWLHHQLGVPVERVVDPEAHTITEITFFFDDDTTVSLSRSASSSVACLSRPGLEDRSVNLARRSVQDSLMEDLRRLDPDVYYGELLTEELPRLAVCSEGE